MQLIKLKPGQFFEILPGESIIASTLEKIELNSGKLAAILHPRSSSARRGLSIESGVIDPFYSGNLIIPIRNNTHHVLKIYPGERICQVLFYELKETITLADASKHGIEGAKYQSATPYNLKMKPDTSDELDLLRAGKLEDLKTKFPIEKKTEVTSNEIKNDIKPEQPKEKINYPYLPEGKDILYVPLENKWMQEAKKACEELIVCCWWPTGAVVVKNEQVIGRGTNWPDGKFTPPCARYINKCATGEGYDLCQTICQASSFAHAEYSAVENAMKNGQDLNGADLYLYGHWWACKDCWDKILEQGIKNVYLLKDSEKIFNRDVRIELQEKFIEKMNNGVSINKEEAKWQI